MAIATYKEKSLSYLKYIMKKCFALSVQSVKGLCMGV